MMAICSFCGKEVTRLIRCRLCRILYCVDCIEPRDHNCVARRRLK
ncbi:hypothetical protein DRO61_07880 [Candidatus Bathyarchaeota archaeon]|nr:MAG: hypothetical protein DRO61_07880 [Candidatus Bathyarchaeota archaeon]